MFSRADGDSLDESKEDLEDTKVEGHKHEDIEEVDKESVVNVEEVEKTNKDKRETEDTGREHRGCIGSGTAVRGRQKSEDIGRHDGPLIRAEDSSKAAKTDELIKYFEDEKESEDEEKPD